MNVGRKAGEKCGFAESLPQERITALKTDKTPVEAMDVTEKVDDIIQKAEVPPLSYPEQTAAASLAVTLFFFSLCTTVT